ncbi:MAG: Bug family tripartite tricarboxylate transporter substrate binding protein [Burkholderiaceae bacterium]
MKHRRREWLAALGLGSAAALVPGLTRANPNWPAKPVRFVSGGAAGGTSDMVARVLQEPLFKSLKQPIIIENIPGLGGLIGAGNAARTTDGHTFFVSNLASNVLSVLLYKNVPFDWRRDLPGVTRVCTLTNGLFVRADSGITSAAQLMDVLRKDSSRRVFSSAAIGTTSHLACVMLGQRLGVELLHVPFKGAAGNLLGLMQGDVFFTIDNLPTFAPQVKSGRIRLLTVSSASRASNYPDVPTIQEVGIPDFDVFSWFGISATKAVDKAVVERVAGEILKQLQNPDIRAQYERMDMTVDPFGPQAYDRFLASEMEKWGATVKAAGLEPV